MITIQEVMFRAAIDFKKFLLFDPKYRKMSDKAKILYSYLLAESATKGIDEEGNYFIKENDKTINKMLLAALNCTRPTLLKTIKELESFDLAEREENGKLYLLQPTDLEE